MKHGLKRLCGAGALTLPLSVGLPALAQQPVVEDLSERTNSFYEQTEARREASGSLVLFNQVQENQEELRQLRGQVEELRHQLDQLRRQTREQYLDIEERLAAGDVGLDSEEVVDEQTARQVAQATSPEASSAEAQAAYQAAFAHVQARDFGQAVDAFDAFVTDHPDSALTANAYYWLGELHSAEGRLEQAATAFQQVLDRFPNSSKVPDTLYKYGLLKARLGQPQESRAMLERVREQYPQSSAAGLANDFLRQAN